MSADDCKDKVTRGSERETDREGGRERRRQRQTEAEKVVES